MSEAEHMELVKEVAALADERDRLLKSLQAAVHWIGQLNDWAGAGDPDIDTWRAAIEKAKGGAKC